MTKAALLDEIAGLNRQLGAARSQGLEDRAHVRDQVLHQPHRTWAKMIRLLLPRMGGGSRLVEIHSTARASTRQSRLRKGSKTK